nr:unnamed protein product [Callosobruchus analis]
MCVPKKMSF